jgi:glycosyltransferase involved in cell wall biosynthesis
MTGFGGAERMLARLLLAKPELTDKRIVVVLRQADALGKQLRSAGFIVHELGMQSYKDIPRIFFQLKQIINSFSPDIVQTWMYHADLLGGLAARISGYENIIWGIRRTSVSFSDNGGTWIIMKLCALLSRWLPKKIISVAEAGKQAHIKAGYDAARIRVIPNGFDFSNLIATEAQRNALRNECKFLEGEVVIGCLGRFDHAKGQDIFVKAAAIVAKHNTKVRFLMVGWDCDAHNVKLNSWINEHNLQDSFVLLGERLDVPACLAAMDIFCMPSRTEGFPNGLGEAMALGLPCVATEVGDTKFLVGDTAILVPAQDEQALAQALLNVIELPVYQRYQMGINAKVRVMAEFSIEKVCDRFEAVYSEIISESVI